MDVENVEEPQPKRPWYAATWALIAAGVAGLVGLALLAVGIVAFLGSAETRNEAAALEAQASSTADEADAAAAQAATTRDAAATLPDLVAEVDTQSYAVLTASEATVDAYNVLIDCVNSSVDLAGLEGCFSTQVAAVEATLAEEVAEVQTLSESISEAKDALAATEVD